MGGMAIGSWICSRLSGRWKNLLRGYALTEALIGLAAFAFHPAFVAATETAHTRILPALGGAFSAVLFKWTLAGLLILPQTVLLGMTFPLMSAGLIRRFPKTPGGSLAMLYFTNSLGAAVGVLVSGFVLIDAFGLPGTVQAAGLLNLVLAAAVWMLATESEAPIAPGADEAATAPAPAPYDLFLVVAALTGTASFIYEIGWIRMLSLVLGSSTHSFELMLSVFILGLALGGLWVRRRIDTIVDTKRFLGIVQVMMGFIALATLPLYGVMFNVMQSVLSALAKTDAGYVVFLLASDAIALAIMLPATFCAGMTLPLITYSLLRGGHGEKSIGAVYAANTAGSIVGVIVAAHVLMPLLGLKGLLAAGAALDVSLGIVLLWRVVGATRLRGVALGAAIACFVAVLALVRLDIYKMASGVFRSGQLFSQSIAHLAFYRDGKTASVSVLDFRTERSIRTNGKSDGVVNVDPKGPRFTDEVTMILTAGVPLAFKPDAKEVAVIGIGTGLTTHTMLSSQTVESVETVEIEPAMAVAAQRFAPLNRNAYLDKRSHIIYDDAKTFFSTYNRKYDIIVSEPSNPWVSGVSSLFTGEFYRLTQRHLKPGGVLVQWFQMYEIDVSLVASVMQALGATFDDYVIYAATGNDLLIVAGDAATLAKPLADLDALPGIGDEMRRAQVKTVGDLDIRRLRGKRTLAPLFASFDVPPNSDYRPFLDLHATKYRFLDRSASAITGLQSYPVPVVDMLEGEERGALDRPDVRRRLLPRRDSAHARGPLRARVLPPAGAAVARGDSAGAADQPRAPTAAADRMPRARAVRGVARRPLRRRAQHEPAACARGGGGRLGPRPAIAMLRRAVGTGPRVDRDDARRGGPRRARDGAARRSAPRQDQRPSPGPPGIPDGRRDGRLPRPRKARRRALALAALSGRRRRRLRSRAEAPVLARVRHGGSLVALDLSIVVPLYNEGDNVEVLHGEICDALAKLGKSYGDLRR